MNTNYSKFNSLYINSNHVASAEFGIDTEEWNKDEVQAYLVNTKLTSKYSGQIGWAEYIISRILDDIDYDEKLIDIFLRSNSAIALTLDICNNGKVTITKRIRV